MTRTKVAVVQMTSKDDVVANMEAVTRLVTRAATEGAKLVVLPECFSFLGPEQGKIPLAEPLPEGGPILNRCAMLAQKFGIELVLGGFWEKASVPNKVRNACVVLNGQGHVTAIYRKIHLFDVDLPDGTKLTESSSVEAGNDVVAVDTVAGKMGLSVCYDLRFPELYRQLVTAGATVLVVPSAFTLMTGKDHWHVLLRARAIESQSYVLAAAQTGHHFGNRVSYGHALIVDPWGTVLAECGEGEGIAVADVDPAVITRIRRSLPSLTHRRF